MPDNFLMKGKVWADHKHKMTYPAVAEVKYDEIRLHVKRTGDEVEFLSYEGKPLCNLESWSANFVLVMKLLCLNHLDMGVLVNGNFNDSFRWCRTKSGWPEEKLDKKTGKIAPALNSSMVEFYLFDVPEIRLPYDLRVIEREHAAQALNLGSIKTSTPLAVECASESEVDAAFDDFRKFGFEGAMVKSKDHIYIYGCAKRIDGWLKMKPEAEADGKIIRIIEAVSEDGVPHGRAGSVEVEMEDGSRAIPTMRDHAFAQMVFENPDDYVGEWVMFTYMERDRAGGYRHPIFGRLREAK